LLYENAEKNPTSFLRLLDAYPIAHNPAATISCHGPLPLPLGTDSPNIWFVGRSRSGKTQKGTFPAVAHAIASGWSFAYINIKGKKQTQIIRRMAKAQGRTCHTIAPRKPDRTVGWTALDGCHDLSVAGEVAACMVASAAGRSRYGEGAWAYNQAQEWIQHAIAAICCDSDKSEHNLIALRRVVLSGRYVQFGEEHPEFPALNKFALYEQGGNRNAETVASTIGEATAFVDDISPFLSAAELSLDKFAQNGGGLILEVDEYDIERLRPLTTLFLGRLIATLQKHACDSPTGCLPHKTVIIIDELAAAGPIPGIGRALHTCRERNFCFVAGTQSVSQLPAIYGVEAETVLSGFQTQVALGGGLDQATAEYFSRLSGVATIALPSMVEEHGNECDTTIARSWQLSSRAVLLPSDISAPQRHPLLGQPATIFVGDGTTPPFQAYLTVAHENGRLDRFMEEVCAQKKDDDRRKRPLSNQQSVVNSTGGVASHRRFTNVEGWPTQRVRRRLDEVLEKIDWANTNGSARKWWSAFEVENQKQLPLVLRLAEEIAARQATITDFFLANVYSNCPDNIEVTLAYLDYMRLKKQHDLKKKSK
jgi:hypothetical protein